jgi:hypothetical protein
VARIQNWNVEFVHPYVWGLLNLSSCCKSPTVHGFIHGCKLGRSMQDALRRSLKSCGTCKICFLHVNRCRNLSKYAHVTMSVDCSLHGQHQTCLMNSLFLIWMQRIRGCLHGNMHQHVAWRLCLQFSRNHWSKNVENKRKMPNKQAEKHPFWTNTRYSVHPMTKWCTET